jgi:dipeptidyl-peptidase-4
VLNASEKLTLKQAILNYRDLAPDNLAQLQWINDTDVFSFTQDSLLLQQEIGQAPKMVLKLNQLNTSLKETGFRNIKRFPKLYWRDQYRFVFWVAESLFSFNSTSDKLKLINTLPKKSENFDLADKSYTIAFTLENNLFISDETCTQIQITNEKSDIVSGQSVSRNEFGISTGTYWSPEENFLAFYQKDESRVDSYPFVNYDSLPAALEPGKYPMAGQSSEYVKLGVYDLRLKTTVWLETDMPEEPEQYLTGVTWSPDEKYIYIAHISRDQNRLQMIRYKVKTGKRDRIIFTEEDDEYIDPQFGPFFSKSNPDYLLWLSERDGWNHLYHYSSSGELLGQITKGLFDITEFLGYGVDGESVYYVIAGPNPTERHIAKTHIKSGKQEIITTESGTHSAQKARVSDHLLVSFSSIDIPRQITLHDGSKTTLDTLLIAVNPLADFELGETEIHSLTLDDGTKLYYSLIFPPDFDPDKKYPMFVYVYGGPHSQRVRNIWLGRTSLWLQYMATLGYVIFTIDNRGTDYRGLEFEQITHRRLGTIEVQDQISGIEYIKNQNYIDTDRIGVFGWSYGGFMTASLLTRAPHVFKVGVSGAPVIDWRYYEIMYTERYMDNPQINADGYDQSTVLTHLDSLDADLLMIHGTSDNIVMWQHSILFTQKAIKLGKQIDYMIYPGHRHGIRGRDRLHLYKKITDYVNARLLSLQHAGDDKIHQDRDTSPK